VCFGTHCDAVVSVRVMAEILIHYGSMLLLSLQKGKIEGVNLYFREVFC
jgi:hypothetical protein